MTPHRRGFTVLELIVAGAIAVLILSAITLALSQLGRSRNVTLARLESSMRARAALESIRRDVASVIRDSDLLRCRVLLTDGSVVTPFGVADRDELLLFSARLLSTRQAAFSGEGIEYETHYRVEDDDAGSVLWQRRDFMPDGYPDAGGVAVPLVEGVLGLRVEAYDGVAWFEEWDSDLDGLPWALRITVTALPETASDSEGDPRGLVTLRTLVPIDRIVPPPQEDEDAKPEDGEVPLDENGNPIDGGEGGMPGEGGEGGMPGVGGEGGVMPGVGGAGGAGPGGRPGLGGPSDVVGGRGAGGGGGAAGRPTSGPNQPGSQIGRGSRSSRIGNARPATGAQ